MSEGLILSAKKDTTSKNSINPPHRTFKSNQIKSLRHTMQDILEISFANQPTRTRSYTSPKRIFCHCSDIKTSYCYDMVWDAPLNCEYKLYNFRQRCLPICQNISSYIHSTEHKHNAHSHTMILLSMSIVLALLFLFYGILRLEPPL